jgi:DnaJ-class molecular chaperone
MTKTDCNRCKGTGTRRDATLADNVAASGSTLAQCATCHGTGVVQKLTMAEMIAEAEAHLSHS